MAREPEEYGHPELVGGGVTDLHSHPSAESELWFPIWAEENSTLGNATYEWAYGNGANTPNSGGVTIFVPSGCVCTLEAMSLRLGGGTATVEAVINGVLQGSVADVTVSSGQGATNTFTPIEISNGDYFNFRTTSASGTSAPCVVCAWFKVTGTGTAGPPGAPGADGDVTWEGAWSDQDYTANQAVEYQGSSYVCIQDTTSHQLPTDTDYWDLLASKGEQGSSGSSPTLIHLTKDSATENIGGANGTKQQIGWDSELRKDAGFTHSNSVNNTRIQVAATSRYRVRATVSAQQTGSARITDMLYIRVNGDTEVKRCTARNYSRGSGYADVSMNINTDIDLNNGDYIEIQTEVDDADSTYTVTTFPAQCECIVEKIE